MRSYVSREQEQAGWWYIGQCLVYKLEADCTDREGYKHGQDAQLKPNEAYEYKRHDAYLKSNETSCGIERGMLTGAPTSLAIRP